MAVYDLKDQNLCIAPSKKKTCSNTKTIGLLLKKGSNKALHPIATLRLIFALGH